MAAQDLNKLCKINVLVSIVIAQARQIEQKRILIEKVRRFCQLYFQALSNQIDIGCLEQQSHQGQVCTFDFETW